MKGNVMKIKDGYLLSDVAGTPVVVPLNAHTSFHSMIKLNVTGKFLWEKLLTDCTREELLAAMVAEYEIDEATASRDLDAFLASLDSFGALEK